VGPPDDSVARRPEDYDPVRVSDLLRVLSLAALVAANAFFVIGEFAVVTARRVVARQGAPRRIAVLVWALRLPLE
jgi:hypothetical protein